MMKMKICNLLCRIYLHIFLTLNYLDLTIKRSKDKITILYLRICYNDFKRGRRETRDLVHEKDYTRVIVTRLI